MGQVFEIVNSLNETERVNVMFTFGYRGAKYVVYKKNNSDDKNYGDRVTCNPWYGICFQYEWNEEAKQIASHIIARAKERPSFRMMGEHYEVERADSSDETYRIRRVRRRAFFSPRMSVYADALRFSVVMTLSVIYAMIRLTLDATSWLYALFPHAPRKTLLIGFWIFHIVATIVIFFIAKKCRSLWSVLYNVLLPSEFIVVAAGLRAHSLMRKIAIVVVLAALVGSVIYKFCSVSKPVKTKKMMKRNLRSALCSTAVAIFVACVVLTRLIGVTSVVYSDTSRAETHDELMSNYAVACENVRPNVWITLDNETKLGTLQAICDYECIVELGCDAPRVMVVRWESETLLGKFSHLSGELSISQDHFENDAAYEVLDTLLHEVRHSWQYSVTKIFNQIESELDEKQLALDFFRDAKEFQYNFDNYYNGDDYDAYAEQGIERDSREWAERRIAEKYYYCLEVD